jgi:fluoride exporter
MEDTRNSMDYEARRQRHVDLQQHSQFDEEESDEDILLTYSSDASQSPTGLRPTTLGPLSSLIQRDYSEGEQSLLIDLHTSPPKPQIQLLMIPPLTVSTEANNIEQPTGCNSTEHMLSAAVHEDNNKAPDRMTIPMPMQRTPSPATISSGQDQPSLASLFNLQEATLVPINMRRSSSSPTKLISRNRDSPRGNATKPSNNSPTKKVKSAFTLLKDTYSLRKQLSLPVATQDGSPLLRSPHGVDDSVLSSESSLTDAQIPEFANEDPEIQKRRNLIPTPTNFRRFTLQQPATLQEDKSPKWEHDEIYRVNTSRTDGSDEDAGCLKALSGDEDNNNAAMRRRTSVVSPLQIEEAVGSEKSNSTREFQPIFQRSIVQYIIYLSTFACFGTIIREVTGTLFGLVGVTTSGMTNQTGGALFVDLPANVLGSFIMGISVLNPDVWLPWLKADHPLQQNHPLYVALTTGLCGSLTTFSSWNTQMVVMLDGSQTVLGPQIVTALCGYLLGLVAPMASFIVGNHVSLWLHNWRNPVEGLPTNDDENPPPIIQFSQSSSGKSHVCIMLKVLFLGPKVGVALLGMLMVLVLVGDWVFGSSYCRALWLSVIFTPPGALLRWSLATRWNVVALRQGLDWIYLGTLAANILASLLSILLIAIELRYFKGASSQNWTLSIITAIRVGTAGSLSTVSTLVKELHDIANQFPNHAKAYYYGGITVGVAMLTSLIVYMPIVRSA